MTQINYSMKSLLFVLFFGTFYSNILHGCDRPIPRFADFEGLAPEQYITRALPQLPDAEKGAAVEAFTILTKTSASPIKEDDGGASVFNLNKIKSESGYNFPAIPSLQGPFLFLCGLPHVQNVMDLGPGVGFDTFMAHFTGKRIIAVDIHDKQQEEMKNSVISLSKHTNRPAPQNIFYLKRNFSLPNTTIPDKWRSGFDVINVNKVFHFLNDQETKTMVNNLSQLVKKEGYICVSVSTPNEGGFEDKEFKKQLQLNNSTPGLIYYDTAIGRSSPGREVVSSEKIKRDTPGLVSPGQKIEFYRGGVLILRQGRHYHTLETLKRYLEPNFTILDSYVTRYDLEDWFISVLAQRRS